MTSMPAARPAAASSVAVRPTPSVHCATTPPNTRSIRALSIPASARSLQWITAANLSCSMPTAASAVASACRPVANRRYKGCCALPKTTMAPSRTGRSSTRDSRWATPTACSAAPAYRSAPPAPWWMPATSRRGAPNCSRRSIPSAPTAGSAAASPSMSMRRTTASAMWREIATRRSIRGCSASRGASVLTLSRARSVSPPRLSARMTSWCPPAGRRP